MTKKKKIILGVGVVGLSTMGFFLWKHIQKKDEEAEVGPLTFQAGHRVPDHILKMTPIRIDELAHSIDARMLGRNPYLLPPPPPPPKS